MNRGARWEAQQCGDKYYIRDTPCVTCSTFARYTCNSDCVQCARTRTRTSWLSKPEDERRAARKRWWHSIAPAVRRERKAKYSRQTLYGLSDEQFVALGNAQGWVCPICTDNLGVNYALVDHDHATGKVRGLLCRSCNFALGFLRDDPVRADNAAVYLRGAV